MTGMQKTHGRHQTDIEHPIVDTTTQGLPFAYFSDDFGFIICNAEEETISLTNLV